MRRLTVGEFGTGPHGRHWDDRVPVVQHNGCACNYPGGVDAEPPLRQTAGGSTTRVLAPDLIGWRDDGAVMRTAECDPGMSLNRPKVWRELYRKAARAGRVQSRSRRFPSARMLDSELRGSQDR